MKEKYLKGLKDGIPIALGYLSVSFAFGIIAVESGFAWWQATLISMLNVTSAGQFAGIGVMLAPGNYLEMIITQLTINIRYSFMTISLSQKVDSKFSGIYRWLLGFGTTDEIFAVSMTQDSVSRSYFFGLFTLPFIGWTMGTLLGAVLGSILPASVISALGLAIYGMFVAIVVPEMKTQKSVLYVVLFAIVLSLLFTYLPGLKNLTSGLTISITAILAALFGAFLFPVEDDMVSEEQQ